MASTDESLLIRYTTELKQHYEKLAEILREYSDDAHGAVEPIRQRMVLVKETEEKLRPLRDSFLAGNDQPQGRLKEVTDETIDLVKDLMPKLAQLEQNSVESLRNLFPRIQGSVRAIQMQNAYRGNHLT